TIDDLSVTILLADTPTHTVTGSRARNLLVKTLGGDDGIVYIADDAAKSFLQIVVDGGTGNDTISGDAQTIRGGDGDDLLNGGGSSNFIQGNNGNDTINGGAGNDHLIGGTGADSINGQDGNDSIEGNEDN